MIPPESNKWPEPLPVVPPPRRVPSKERIAELLARGQRNARELDEQLRDVFTLTEREWNLVLR